MIRALKKKYIISHSTEPPCCLRGSWRIKEGGEECNNFPRPRNLTNWSEIYRYVFTYWLYKYIFLFPPPSSSSASVWKQLASFRCWHEVKAACLLYRCVRLSFLSLWLQKWGCSAVGREWKEIQRCRPCETERDVALLFHRGRCHSGANAPTGGTWAGHLTSRTALSRCVHFWESCARRRFAHTKHVDRPDDHKHLGPHC